MNIQEIEEGGKLALEVVEGGTAPVEDAVADERKAISAEEYQELADLQTQQTALKANAYDIAVYARNARAQAEAAEKKLEEVEESLNGVTTSLVEKYNTLVSKYGFQDAKAVNIEKTEPHYITEVQVPAPTQ